MLSKELLNFKITPSVVKADKVSKISITGLGDYYRFYDDVTYTVTLYSKEIPDCDLDDDFTLGRYQRTPFTVKPKDGTIEFEYNFKGEQEWDIEVCASPEQRGHLTEIYRSYPDNWNQKELEQGLHFKVFSLLPDLYERKVLKGDMHIHSSGSDGKEPAEIVAANYRRHGFDYISLNDHHNFAPSIRAQEKFKEFDSHFTVFTGEEVHNKILGRFHVVSFDAKESVNEIILSDREKVKAEVKASVQKIEGLSDSQCEEVAWYRWICEKIREKGGLSIFVHPYWTVYGAYNCPTNIAQEVFKRGYFDAFEVMGGCQLNENNMQTALYNEMRAEGVRMPIVGSTDSHTSHEYGKSRVGMIYTIAFAKDKDSVKEAVCNLYSVAGEELSGKGARFTGPFRLVKYAHFLADNYFPLRDRLCAASGEMMLSYFYGDKSAKDLIEKLEEKIEAFENEFFGKNA